VVTLRTVSGGIDLNDAITTAVGTGGTGGAAARSS